MESFIIINASYTVLNKSATFCSPVSMVKSHRETRHNVRFILCSI
jgi:hypothetical protein